jgi:predicted nucleotidyltransferase
MKRDAVLTVLKKHKRELEEKYNITRLGIFGSVARDEAGEDSDIDVVVETKVPDLFLMVGLKYRLESLLGMPVDLIRFRPRMNPYLKNRIQKEAKYV